MLARKANNNNAHSTHPLALHSFHAHNHPSFSLDLQEHYTFFHEAMRDRRMDRLVIFPFSVGCVSESSVAISKNQPKRVRIEAAAPAPSKGGGGGRRSSGKTISAGLHKLLKSLKSFSQLFVLDKEEEDEEAEMEIGFPTDVQHVAHIGCDGVNSMSTMGSWGRAPECLSLPSLSPKPFEQAMAAQAGVPPPPHGPLRA